MPMELSVGIFCHLFRKLRAVLFVIRWSLLLFHLKLSLYSTKIILNEKICFPLKHWIMSIEIEERNYFELYIIYTFSFFGLSLQNSETEPLNVYKPFVGAQFYQLQTIPTLLVRNFLTGCFIFLDGALYMYRIIHCYICV